MESGVWFQSDWVKPNITIGISSFSVKHVGLRAEINEWLALNQNRENDRSTADCCLSELAIKSVALVHNWHHYFAMCNLFTTWYSWRIAQNHIFNLHFYSEPCTWRNQFYNILRYGSFSCICNSIILHRYLSPYTTFYSVAKLPFVNIWTTDRRLIDSISAKIITGKGVWYNSTRVHYLFIVKFVLLNL